MKNIAIPKSRRIRRYQVLSIVTEPPLLTAVGVTVASPDPEFVVLAEDVVRLDWVLVVIEAGLVSVTAGEVEEAVVSVEGNPSFLSQSIMTSLRSTPKFSSQYFWACSATYT